MGFREWFIKPFTEILIPEIDWGETKVKVLDEYIPHQVALYRPQTLEQYIGQTRAKGIIRCYLDASKKRQVVLPHILIHGPAGYGKTTLARLVANEMRVPFHECITSTINTPIELLIKINDSKFAILFLDEIHALDRSAAESMYSIMEDFSYNGEAVAPFTLVGATTELGELMRDRRPFVDRFKIHIELEDYTESELAILGEQFRNLNFPKDPILSKEIYLQIAKNARSTPRTAIRLIEATTYLNGDIAQVLDNFSIIKDGYTNKDLKLLKYIQTNEKGVGLQGLISYMSTSAENYNYNIEPYLLRQDLIIRTARGRKITELGKQKIVELEQCKRS